MHLDGSHDHRSNYKLTNLWSQNSNLRWEDTFVMAHRSAHMRKLAPPHLVSREIAARLE